MWSFEKQVEPSCYQSAIFFFVQSWFALQYLIILRVPLRRTHPNCEPRSLLPSEAPPHKNWDPTAFLANKCWFQILDGTIIITNILERIQHLLKRKNSSQPACAEGKDIATLDERMEEKGPTPHNLEFPPVLPEPPKREPESEPASTAGYFQLQKYEPMS